MGEVGRGAGGRVGVCLHYAAKAPVAEGKRALKSSLHLLAVLARSCACLEGISFLICMKSVYNNSSDG